MLLQSDFYGLRVRIQAFDFSQTDDVFCFAFEGRLGIMDEAGFLDKMIDGIKRGKINIKNFDEFDLISCINFAIEYDECRPIKI